MFDIFRRVKKIIIKSPFTGKVIKLNEVPDKVFSEKMVGDGVAIIPESNILYAPISGEIIQLFSTNHALGIRTEEGLEILIHLGIDSVKLGGRGFNNLISEGEIINTGDKLINVLWEDIENDIVSIASPLIITNMEMVKDMNIINKDYVKAGENLLSIKI